MEACEEAFGAVRGQLVPCDSSIQLEDVSQTLKPADASNYRSVVGMALYLGRDRPDAIFAIKELAGKMGRPTLTSLQQSKKLVDYVKQTGNVGVKLAYPLRKHGSSRPTQMQTGLVTECTGNLRLVDSTS